jgi:hypothetical protein
MKYLDFVLERLKEKSTWAGLIGLLGLSFSAELGEAIVTAVLGFIAVVAVLIKEKKKDG